MSYHSDLDYACQHCGERYLPFGSAMNCPRCFTAASEKSEIVEETLEALRWHDYDHPGAYSIPSLADSYILFASEVAGTVNPVDDPTEVALRCTSQMEAGRPKSVCPLNPRITFANEKSSSLQRRQLSPRLRPPTRFQLRADFRQCSSISKKQRARR
jgi:hypothetical protein